MHEKAVGGTFGIAGQSQAVAGVKLLQCAHCLGMNSPISNYYSTCGHPLTVEAEQKMVMAEDQIKRLLMEDPKARAIFGELLSKVTTQQNPEARQLAV